MDSALDFLINYPKIVEKMKKIKSNVIQET